MTAELWAARCSHSDQDQQSQAAPHGLPCVPCLGTPRVGRPEARLREGRGTRCLARGASRGTSASACGCASPPQLPGRGAGCTAGREAHVSPNLKLGRKANPARNRLQSGGNPLQPFLEECRGCHRKCPQSEGARRHSLALSSRGLKPHTSWSLPASPTSWGSAFLAPGCITPVSASVLKSPSLSQVSLSHQHP